MAFLILFLCGVLGGVPAGMGMGGGTVLIPLLTLFGVEQSAAQGLNLAAFLPMAALALPVHARGGLLRAEGLPALMLPALCCSALASLIATRLPSRVLECAFGVFLLALFAVRVARAIGKKRRRDRVFRQKTDE